MKTKLDFPPGTKVRVNDYFLQKNHMDIKIRDGIVVNSRKGTPFSVSVRRGKSTGRWHIDFLDIIP